MLIRGKHVLLSVYVIALIVHLGAVLRWGWQTLDRTYLILAVTSLIVMTVAIFCEEKSSKSD